jgi:uncharacterized protein DUF4476
MTRNILLIASLSLLSVTQVSAQEGSKEKEVVVENKTLITYRNSCQEPVTHTRFYEFFNDLKSEYEFDNERLRVAEMAVEAECFTSKQIGITMTAFTYEHNRVAFAKFAYAYAFNKSAYSDIKGGFLHSSSWEEVEDYIANK